MNRLEYIIADLSTMKEELAKTFGVYALGLFGSITREDFLPELIDILGRR